MKKQLHILINYNSQQLRDALAAELNLQQVGIGELFRVALRAKNEIGLEIQSYFDRGELVPDELVHQLVETSLIGIDADVLLVGYPRTRAQCHLLMNALHKHRIELQQIWIMKIRDVEQIIQFKFEQTKHDPAAKKYWDGGDSIRQRFKNYMDCIEEVCASVDNEQLISVIETGFPLRNEEELIQQALTNYKANS